MNAGGIEGHAKDRTICEVHREMYRYITNSIAISDQDKRYLIMRIKEAFNYGKKLSNKLKQYKNDLEPGWYFDHKLDGGELHD